MHPPDVLLYLFRHHRWANLRLLECCRPLTTEQMQATIPGAYGTLHETLQHLATSERSYFTRISTGQPYPPSANPPPMTLDDMQAVLETTGAGLLEWAPRIRAQDIVSLDWDGTPRETPKQVILAQALLHACEHREQIKAIMTSLGVEPPDLQSWAFYDEDQRAATL